MKRWEKYKEFLSLGDWHVHTSYTDGKNTVYELCRRARENRLRLIAFTEHVRRTLTYRFEDLVKAGVIDPTKVTRTALENAASVAALLLMLSLIHI